MQTVRDRPDTNRLSISVINCERPPWKAGLCVLFFNRFRIIFPEGIWPHTSFWSFYYWYLHTHLALIILLLLSTRGPWLFYFCYLYFPYPSSQWSVYVSTLPWYGVLSVHNTRRFSRAVFSQDVFHVLCFYKTFFTFFTCCVLQDVFTCSMYFTRRFSRAVFYKTFFTCALMPVLYVFHKTFFTCCALMPGRVAYE